MRASPCLSFAAPPPGERGREGHVIARAGFEAGQFLDELFGEEEPARDAQAAFVEEELQAGQEVALGDVEAAASRDCVLSAAGDGDVYEAAR